MRTDRPEPMISRVFPDGTIIELIYQPDTKITALAVGRPDGSISVVAEFTGPDGERFGPYSARNNLIATECILLPSEVTEFGSKEALLADIGAFLHRYVDLSPAFETVAAHYVLLAWVYEAFNELPYLRFRGDFGTGKTRALLAVGSLCYKPFFASGASTVSPIFHILEAFRGTLILDEADFRFSDATASLTKILNNGNLQGMPVLRTMSNRNGELNPQAYRVFGPKLIGMRGRFTDVALESRFVTEETGSRPLRDDIPIQLPAALRDEARGLRNKLLCWRMRTLATLAADPSRLPRGLSPRSRQTALALLTLMDDELARAQFVDQLREDGDDLRGLRGPTAEVLMVTAILESFGGGADGAAPVAAIAQAFNAKAATLFGRPMPNRWVGSFLRSRLGLTTTKTRGVYVVPAEHRAQVMSLAGEFGVPIASE